MKKIMSFSSIYSWVVMSLISGCATVSLDQPKTSSEAIARSDSTYFGNLAAGWSELHGEKTGFFPLADGKDALGARLDMLEKAEKTIDLQYFLMKDDSAGLIMTHALLQAADRGVRIRFLLDDVFTTAKDSNLLLLDQHPNIEVRLFNPVARRGLWSLNVVGNYRQASRRMHNKSFTVDNAISIVGGRNLADEYFQLKEESAFVDFDLLVFGPIVSDISDSFDRFWNYARAVPVQHVVKSGRSEELEIARDKLEAESASVYGSVYQSALNSELMQNLITGVQPLFVANARLMADRPDKLDNKISGEHMLLVRELDEVLRDAIQEVLFITPYYVPGDDGIDYARNLVEDGVRVVVLTNSLASTNHTAVHSGYSDYRKKAIDAGIELYEVRANAGKEVQGSDGPDQLTLHTKLILIDRRYLFVGSLNLDPRSIEINAEMGILIDSADMTSLIATALDNDIPAHSYRILKNERNKLEWHGILRGKKIVETREPLSSWWRRTKAWILKIAPESQL